MNVEYVHGDCIFTRVNPLPRQYPYLTEDVKTDVIIVGGGVTGAILGYYFSRNNIDTVILEKSRIGHGSTSITTSLLQYELDSNAMKLKEYISLEKVIRAYQLGVTALDEIQAFIDAYGNDCGFRRADGVLYTAKDIEKKEIAREYELRSQAGFPVSFIENYNNPFCFDLKAGIISKNGAAHFDPYRYTHSLLEVGCNKGLRVYENTEVNEVSYTERGVTAHTSYNHKVQGKIIIVATGYNTQLFSKRVFGVKSTTFNVATTVIKNLQDIYKQVVFRDNADPYNYFRTTQDNRLIIGGEDIEFRPYMNNQEVYEQSYKKLEQRLKGLFSDLSFDIEYKYCGAFASTPDNLGFLGKDPKNPKLWYCLGYGANGILFAILGGLMLSKLYLGKLDNDLGLFNVNRFE